MIFGYIYSTHCVANLLFRHSSIHLFRGGETKMSAPASLTEGKTINLGASKIGMILEFSENERGSSSSAGNHSDGPNLQLRAGPFAGTNIQRAAIRNLLTGKEQEQIFDNATVLTYRRGGNIVF